MIEPIQLHLLTDVALLAALCSEEQDHELYAEFVKRFLPAVKEECLRMGLRRKVDKHISAQIAHDTFEKARRYKTFRADEIKIADTRKAILLYLFKISVNLFNNYFKKEQDRQDKVQHRTYFDDLYAPIEVVGDAVALQRKKELALTIFSKLNTKEKTVVLTDLEYKKHQKYLPDDVNEELASKLGVKKDTVRKIRERAIAKIKILIDEINRQ